MIFILVYLLLRGCASEGWLVCFVGFRFINIRIYPSLVSRYRIELASRMLLSIRQFPLKSRRHVYYSHPWWQPTNRPNDPQVGQCMRLNAVNHIEEVPMCKLYTWSLWSKQIAKYPQSWLILGGRLYDDIWGSRKNRRIICWELDAYSRRLSCNESGTKARHNPSQTQLYIDDGEESKARRVSAQIIVIMDSIMEEEQRFMWHVTCCRTTPSLSKKLNTPYYGDDAS